MSVSQTPSTESLAALRLVAAGRSYDAVAADLAIAEASVRELARTAVDTFAGPAADALTNAERERIADWLLGQTMKEPLVERSPAAREYAEAAAASAWQTQGVNLRPLPASETAKKFVQPGSPKSTGTLNQPKPQSNPKTTASSSEGGRRAGVALLGLGAAALVVGALAALGVFSGSSSTRAKSSISTSAATKPQTTTSQTTPNGSQLAGWTLSKRFDLAPVTGASGRGIAGLESKGQQHALLVAGTGLSPGVVVGIWVTGGPAPGLVGFQRVTSKGEFSAVGAVPASASSADRLIVTEEHITKSSPPPTAPGRILLSSPFGL